MRAAVYGNGSCYDWVDEGWMVQYSDPICFYGQVMKEYEKQTPRKLLRLYGHLVIEKDSTCSPASPDRLSGSGIAVLPRGKNTTDLSHQVLV